MSTSIIVQVPVYDSRRGKEVNVPVPHDQVHTFLHGVEARKLAAQQLSEHFAAQPSEELPDLLIVYKGQASVLANVPATHDEVVKRALNAALGTKAYDVPDPVPRGPRTAPSEG